MLTSLEQLYAAELRLLHGAEGLLLEALPELADSARSSELRRALTEHHALTREHAARLERLLSSVKSAPETLPCTGVEGILEELRRVRGGPAAPAVLDAFLIVGVQKIEHYEIAGYGSARAFAGTLGADVAHRQLQVTLNEEADLDRTLSKLAEDHINLAAVAGSTARFAPREDGAGDVIDTGEET